MTNSDLARAAPTATDCHRLGRLASRGSVHGRTSTSISVEGDRRYPLVLRLACGRRNAERHRVADAHWPVMDARGQACCGRCNGGT